MSRTSNSCKFSNSMPRHYEKDSVAYLPHNVYISGVIQLHQRIFQHGAMKRKLFKGGAS